jgi:CheY-like chemotaxis protein
MPNRIKKIFIADDDEGIVDATSMMLKAMGYDVASTLNGSSVKAAMQQRPDLLLLDIWMSGIDGRDICRELKQDPSTRDIPVLMVSASREIKQSALSCGADDFLAKPFEMDTLLEKIERLTPDL